MMITVMEGWPTETIFFSFVFPLFFLIFIYVLSCLREEWIYKKKLNSKKILIFSCILFKN
jgi:hypothetical protein